MVDAAEEALQRIGDLWSSFHRKLDVDGPTSVEDLRRWFLEVIPGHLRDAHNVEPSFPADLVAGIEEQDVVFLYQAVDPQALRFGQDFCYAEVAHLYFVFSLPMVVFPEDAEEIGLRLREYGQSNLRGSQWGADISVPALFFLCAFAADSQRKLGSRRAILKSAKKELRRATAWARRAPLARLAKCLEEAVQDLSDYHQQFSTFIRQRGTKQGGQSVEPVRTAFLAIREMIAASKPYVDVKPRKEVLDLLRLWGVEISEEAADHWIRQADTPE